MMEPYKIWHDGSEYNVSKSEDSIVILTDDESDARLYAKILNDAYASGFCEGVMTAARYGVE